MSRWSPGLCPVCPESLLGFWCEFLKCVSNVEDSQYQVASNLVIDVNMDESSLGPSNLLVQGLFLIPLPLLQKVSVILDKGWSFCPWNVSFSVASVTSYFSFSLSVSCAKAISFLVYFLFKLLTVHAVLSSLLLNLPICTPHQCKSSIIKMLLISWFLFLVTIFSQTPFSHIPFWKFY